MIINMIGSDHVRDGMNKHDMAFEMDKLKVVTDGCGSGMYSEVGVTLFQNYFMNEINHIRKANNAGEDFEIERYITHTIDNFFNDLFYKHRGTFGNTESFMYNDTFIYNHLLFTILVCVEKDDKFIVYSAGDGFILAQNKENTLELIELDAGVEYPAYYVYNFIKNKGSMFAHDDGVKIKRQEFLKDEYTNVGVASDGIRFISELFANDRDEFKSYIVDQREGKAEMFIKKNQNGFKLYNRKGESKDNIFKDDIAIVF